MQSSTLFKPRLKTLLLYLVPGILVYGFVVFVPLIGGVWQSLHSDFNFQLRFVGLRNYVDLLQDGDFWFSFKNNLVIIALSIVFQVGTAFVIAVLMNNKFVAMPRFLRSAIFFPVILSPVVTSFVWLLVYDVNNGLLNRVLAAVGLAGLRQQWLDNPDIVLYSITAALVWQYIGLYLVIFLAGLSSIPSSVLEAAEIDGANTVQKTLHVILPQMVGTWAVALVLAISGGLKIFEHPFVMTGGGPGLSSTVVAQYAYDQSFLRVRLTYGNTIAIVIVVLSLLLVASTIFILNRFTSRQTS